MRNRRLHLIAIYTLALFLLALTVYILGSDSKITADDICLTFPVYYLMLCSGYIHIVEFQTSLTEQKKTLVENIKLILGNTQYILLSLFLTIIFALLLNQANFLPLNIFAIALLSLLLYNASFLFFSVKSNHYLYWTNLYIFMLSFLVYKVSDVLISGYNPFGSLIPFILQ